MYIITENLQIAFFKNIVPLFKPKWTPSVNTINRILHTSMGEQLSATGNISNNMFDFIDDNKYFLTDNRTAFIQHDNKYSTFTIEHSKLPYSNWINKIHNILCNANNMFRPFTLIEKISSVNKNQIIKIEQENRLNHNGKSEISLYKKQKVEETEIYFKHIKQDFSMTMEIKNDLMDTLTQNMSVIFMKELSKVFHMDDGEYLLSRLSEEQKGCLYSMIEYAYPEDFKYGLKPSIKNEKSKKNFGKVFASIPKIELSDPFFKIFIIEGSAGCGKSAIIESLNFYSFKNHNKYTKLLYVTQTNVLCQSMRKKCFYNNNMQYLTFYKFLSTLNLSYYNTQQLLLNCDALKLDSFQNTCGTDFLTKIKSIIRLPIMPEGDVDDSMTQKPRLFIIFDEVYTLTQGKLSLFLFMVRCLKQTYPKLTIYCILIGDKYQLRPFTKIENIKVSVKKNAKTNNNTQDKKSIENIDDIIKKEIDEDQEQDLNLKDDDDYDDEEEYNYTDKSYLYELNRLSLISQHESVENATKFFLTQQFRIVDEKYNNFVNRVRDAENRVDMGIQILEEFKSQWEEKINNVLSMKYPIKAILKILDNIKPTSYKNIVRKFIELGLFDKTIDTTVFCFTNMHAHYYNLSLALSYWNQLNVHYKKISNFFISFVLIYNSDYLPRHVQAVIHEAINRANYIVNVLPLIRYCPYKILTSNSPVARLSIVYILDWLFNSKNEITTIIVFSPDTNLIFSVIPSKFEMNFLKHGFGFPLQLAFSSTFASSQGLTLNNKIAISCTNISKAELYVCLTRIKTAKDLVRLY